MKKLGSNYSDIKCCIGPCIGEESYEVRNDFYNSITSNDAKNRSFFNKISSNKFNLVYNLLLTN